MRLVPASSMKPYSFTPKITNRTNLLVFDVNFGAVCTLLRSSPVSIAGGAPGTDLRLSDPLRLLPPRYALPVPFSLKVFRMFF